ncbi:FecCD family ABC transporter permease [Salinicoccus hispanicus]|uniref:Iron chelate uptake ABC transporter family permease subunit n=1 Tax=Salinicoccus hispanicus TaxID=157225 RepID=A0A6N8TZ21_9STAP|nr:iron ABC transporter permease [Salinicoccus hispanicus]MXQ51248.1 iron chelate uptake ABC transporter family permease subunit [Salinicoccus hispanicus]
MDRKWYPLPIVVMGILLSFVLAMMFGTNTYTLKEVFDVIFNLNMTDQSHQILYEIRMPRVLGALLAGFMISISGLVLQSVTHNELSEPSILGVNAGANLAIILAALLLPALPFVGVMASGFIGGMIVGLFILSMTRYRSPMHLILAGAGISLLLYAVTDFLVITFNLGQYVAFFTAGGAAGQSMSNIAIVFPIAVVLVIILLFLSKELDVLLFGDEMAVSLGQNQTLYRRVTLTLAIMLASMAVAMVGNVVFLGLLVPHIIKMLFGNLHRFTIIYTGLAGGIIFALADTLARVFNETPVNAIIAVIGLPFFIYIIKKRGAKYA